MTLYRNGVLVLVTLLLTAAAGAQTTQPATEPAGADKIPDTAIQAVTALLEPPERSMSRPELLELMQKRFQQVIARGRQIEQQYPDAPNLYQVRGLMLQSAAWLAMRDDPQAPQQARDIAQRILASDAPSVAKAQAGFHLLRQELASEGDDPPADAAQRIDAYVDRYRQTDANVAAMVRGAFLANQAQQRGLLSDLLDELEDHADDAEARQILRMAGRHPDIGRPFKAELTRLNGQTLNLPEDLLGKVVVVDFWATWCGPCIAGIPHMKQVYAKYKDRGVEFVGISLDRDRDDLVEMVRQRKLDWIQTYPGHDAADAHGVRGIPSIWVVGKDGKVVSDNARFNLENTIRQALAAETATQPAAGQDD
jgi:thiol-disulfide isomerase/thioredoxin